MPPLHKLLYKFWTQKKRKKEEETFAAVARKRDGGGHGHAGKAGLDCRHRRMKGLSFKIARRTADQMGKKRRHTAGGGGRHTKVRRASAQATEYLIEKHSKLLESYYTRQGICRDAHDFESLMQCLRVPLPSALRIMQSSALSQYLRDYLANCASGELKLVEKVPADAAEDNAPPKSLEEGDQNETREQEEQDIAQFKLPEPIRWFPDNLAWSLSIPRTILRKHESLKAFNTFIKHQAECGIIARQEAVSMIPPMFLQIEAGHRVLDLCAAPGSKTSQIVDKFEMLRRQNPAQMHSALIVANDANVKRAFLVVHTMKRFGCPNLVVTNHDGQTFPGAPGTFDRVLADVPCSGDGTIRKQPDIWRSFHPRNGRDLHPVQVQIAKRGIELLKPGGIMVYSTCSMNPIENEAVVSELLRSCPVDLEDARDRLPELVTRPGLTHWFVDTGSVTQDGTIGFHEPAPDHTALSALLAQQTEAVNGSEFKPKLSASMFPPRTTPEEAHIVSSLPLCVRLIPHDNDTGAFFVAVLRKRYVRGTSDGKDDARTTEARTCDDRGSVGKSGDGTAAPEDVKTVKAMSFKSKGFSLTQVQDPLAGLSDERDGAIIDGLASTFGIDRNIIRSHFMSRARTMAEHALTTRGAGLYLIVHAGTRILERGASSSKETGADAIGDPAFLGATWRLTYEGVHVLLPYMTKRVIRVSREGFVKLLAHRVQSSSTLGSTVIEPADIEGDSFKASVDALGMGSFVCVHEHHCVTLWQGRGTLTLMMTEDDLDSLRKVYGVEPMPFRLTTRPDPQEKAEADEGNKVDNLDTSECPQEEQSQ
ncbi:tRNA (cytosine(34)-C(5))-methyltransferase [Porphyridium purpureum]|uniref:tRNA (Cytosine(34)-C(5))-methyltransferase n=1 Tax=Porphyridium purpureum TaxID=35688 RepID=A0A5J4YNG3_PORPP|nr:tRNA (cytosine(34)-C(5))-methyltransferase [Porphyridium purpureum]|eukprot:POR5783..scf222_8